MTVPVCGAVGGACEGLRQCFRHKQMYGGRRVPLVAIRRGWLCCVVRVQCPLRRLQQDHEVYRLHIVAEWCKHTPKNRLRSEPITLAQVHCQKGLLQPP
jgi:hypothetical protein